MNTKPALSRHSTQGLALHGLRYVSSPISPYTDATTASSTTADDLGTALGPALGPDLSPDLSLLTLDDGATALPRPPSNTPVTDPTSDTDAETGLISPTASASSLRKVAAALGDGWLSTSKPMSCPSSRQVHPDTAPAAPRRVFPVPGSNTAFAPATPMKLVAQGGATFSTPPRTSTSTFPSTANEIAPTYQCKSPGPIAIVPDDGSSRYASASAVYSPAHRTERAKLAMKHLVPPSPTKDELSYKYLRSQQFDPFKEEDEYDPLIVDWGHPNESPGAHRPSPACLFYTGPASPSPRSRYSRLYRQSYEPETHLVYNSDVGEGRNVYLPELSSTASEDVLRKVGMSFGRVVSIKVEHNGNTTPDSADMLPDGACRSSRTYAFVMFDSYMAAHKFMKYMNENHVACQLGKETPHLKQKALEDPHSSNLYVAEIPFNYTEQEMHKLFHPGIISSLRFLTDDQGNRRGTAMSRAQADEAIERLDLKVQIPGCARPLQVRIADSENQKHLKKYSNMARSPTQLEPVRSPVTPTTPVSPSPVRGYMSKNPCATFPRSSSSSSPFGNDVDDLTLIEHMKACEDELRFRRQSSQVFHHRAVSLQNQQPSPDLSFDVAHRRPSTDGIDVFHSLLKSAMLRKASFDHLAAAAGTGAAGEEPAASPAVGYTSHRSALKVTPGRSGYGSPLGTGWETGASGSGSGLGTLGSDSMSQDSSTSASVSAASSFDSVGSPYCPVVPDVFGGDSRFAL